ncbi:MAG: hypothetical protein JO062_20225 [Bryobacterales bacterium]|nr:hypothetical protein [Bryobacterales bacterium]
MRRTTMAVSLLGAALVFTNSGAAARKQEVSLRRHHAPIIIHERHGRNVASDNWSGYAVTGVKGSVTDAKGSWIVPSVTCPSSGDEYSSFWVGIDGYSSNTVEQVGTDSDCVNGVPTYYAWYEFYPHFAYTIRSITVKPGDVISAEVTASGKGTFTVTITDGNERPFSVSTHVPNAAASSAEWIAEAPYSGGVLPLANFGTVLFGQDSTAVMETCNATIGGTSGPIGSPSFANDVAEITMVNGSGATKAAPSDLSSDGSSFSVAWVSSGP